MKTTLIGALAATATLLSTNSRPGPNRGAILARVYRVVWVSWSPRKLQTSTPARATTTVVRKPQGQLLGNAERRDRCVPRQRTAEYPDGV